MRCMLCGRVIPAGLEGPLFGVLPQSYTAERLPLVLPGESLEDNSSEQVRRCSSSHQATSLVTGRSRDEKIPVQSKFEESEFSCLNLLCLVSVFLRNLNVQ